MDRNSISMLGAAALIMSTGGAGGFLDPELDERRFFSLDMPRKREPGYGFDGRKLDRSPAAKKALAKKKASKKARKANRRG